MLRHGGIHSHKGEHKVSLDQTCFDVDCARLPACVNQRIVMRAAHSACGKCGTPALRNGLDYSLALPPIDSVGAVNFYSY